MSRWSLHLPHFSSSCIKTAWDPGNTTPSSTNYSTTLTNKGEGGGIKIKIGKSWSSLHMYMLTKSLYNFNVGISYLKKSWATHSSILAWKIAWTDEPGGLQSMRSQKVRHDWATAHTCTCITHTHKYTQILFLKRELRNNQNMKITLSW